MTQRRNFSKKEGDMAQTNVDLDKKTCLNNKNFHGSYIDLRPAGKEKDAENATHCTQVGR